MSSTKPIILFFLLSLNIHLNAQTNFWTSSKADKSARVDIQTKVSSRYNLDVKNLKQALGSKLYSKAGLSLDVPMPDGSFETFQVKPSKVMSSQLAAKYPEILTFAGHGPDGMEARFDLTPKGFHAMIFGPDGTIFIDPISQVSIDSYQSYYKKDYIQKEVTLLKDDIFKTEGTKINTKQNRATSARTSGTELREYRLAVTTTGEYAQFHGGTIADALSAIVTTMNRVNGIYEREVAIRMILIANNDQIIYTDPVIDPYTNDDTEDFINEVQENIDLVIGAADYDIGHGFSTGAGGLAGTGPCSSSKATGVTGISNPIGDPFDVDFVAHEIGHQFSASHTFNGSSSNCSGANRNASTAYEPGSGTTILAYAGICSPQNIQNNSDPYFHTASYDEILNYSVNGTGNSCATITNTGNNPPSVDAGEDNFIIPVDTPFTLTGSGSDPDGDDLTFSWEQFDLGPTGAPENPSGNAPLFRSFSPKDTPSRTFPDVSDIVSNSQTMGELLPTYSRDLTFRLTARDNKNGGGGVNYDEMSFEATDKAGPFLVSSFNTSTTIEALNNVTIDWDVANTNGSEVDCQMVNILLSEDGGVTYSHTLKSSTSNDGSETILIPNISTAQGRIKVEAVGNVFFDINNSDINIQQPVDPNFNLNLTETKFSVCAPQSVQIEVSISSILGFSEDVTLSLDGLEDDLEANFNVNPVTPGNSSILTISNTDNGANGNYSLIINGSSASKTKSQLISVDVFDQSTNNLNLLSPENMEEDVSLFPTIVWELLDGRHEYELDIDTDQNFSNPIISVDGITANSYAAENLESNSTYFLRVRGTNVCEQTPYNVVEFSTQVCLTDNSQDIPILISENGTPTVTSEIDIATSGIISDINVLNLSGSHSYVSDLIFTLISPIGTEVVLLNGICDSDNDFNLGLDDQANTSSISCPPTDGEIYKPSESLASFIGEQSSGTWILRIEDTFNVDGGQLDSWSLEICTAIPKPPVTPSGLSLEPISVDQIDLNWTDNSNNEEFFIIERSIGDNSAFVQIATVNSNISNYEDNNLLEPNIYFYRVKARNSGGDSDYTNEESESTLVLGTYSEKNQLIKVYPNPSSGLFNLVIPKEELKSEITVYNLVGSRVNATITNESGNLSIDLNNYPNGTYFIKLQSISSNHIIRLVKK